MALFIFRRDFRIFDNTAFIECCNKAQIPCEEISVKKTLIKEKELSHQIEKNHFFTHGDCPGLRLSFSGFCIFTACKFKLINIPFSLSICGKYD